MYGARARGTELRTGAANVFTISRLRATLPQLIWPLLHLS
jgi:hypothetical protein